jgi:hypothetical protein
MMKKHALFMMVAIIAILSMLSGCAVPFNGVVTNGKDVNFSVPIELNLPGSAARGLIDDPKVDRVVVVVFNDLFAQVGGGPLTKGATSWYGGIEVPDLGQFLFFAVALDSKLQSLYQGQAFITVTGVNDVVTIAVAPLPAAPTGLIYGVKRRLSRPKS